jgi:ATP-dependent DNA ligase I
VQVCVLLRFGGGRDLISDVASFSDFARLCQLLSQTTSRLQMAEAVGEFLASLDLDEAELAARFIIGRPLALGEEKKLHVSGRAIWKTVAAMTGGDDQGEEIFAAAEDFGEAVEMLLKLRPVEPEPLLTIGEVAASFAAIAAIEGRSARARKLAALGELFGRATALEGKYLAKILIGEMRHGVSEGLMVEAIARMAGRPAAEVRRAHMLEGDLGRVVRAMRTGGGAEPARTAARALALRPIKPMLAEPVAEIADAFAILGGQLALEHKLDGARVQIHHAGAETRIFSRRLNEITASIPEIAEQARALGARNVILDGEVIAVDAQGMPLAFQELMRRLSRQREIERVRGEFPIRLYLFDLIGLDGELCIDRPYTERTAMLGEIARAAGMETVGRIEPKTLVAGEEFYRDAVGAGFEGVVAKSLASKYTPGVRGRGWLKIKRARTLDLVIVAADWGYGRRKGWLSNYHLAARDEQSGEFSKVGKTFKGLSDEQFETMTRRLLGLELEQAHGTVIVRPAVVVEVAYSDLQRSRQYPTGMALRFARIVAVRDDKRPEEVDTIQAITREFERQPIKPAGRKPAGSIVKR